MNSEFSQNNSSPAEELRQAVQAFASAYHLEESRPLVGFSGGVDSTALLLLLLPLYPQLTAVHFHHGLRGDAADADEEFCRSFCRKRSIDFASRHLEVPANRRSGESEEEAGRRLRLSSWQELSEDGKRPVFLAHHNDDCLEELFLRLGRGANASGLTSLRPYRRLGGLQLCRPLLAFPKASLERFVISQGVTCWCHDDTNDDTIHRRNAVRNLLLPSWQKCFGTLGGLRQSLEVLRQDADCLEELSSLKLREIADSPNSLALWNALPSALLPRVLRLWLASQGLDLIPGRSLIARFHDLLQTTTAESRDLPLCPNRILRLSGNSLRLVTMNSAVDNQDITWDWQNQPVLAWQDGLLLATAVPPDGTVLSESFDRDALPPALQIRSWLSGDAMIPFGHHSPKKLQDLFINAKIPQEQRHSRPVILAGSTIIWVPGVRRAEFGRLASPDSERIILSWKAK